MAMDALTESQRAVFEVFGTTDRPGEPMTTSEVAERLDVTRRSAYGRLDRMVERGLLETKKVGSRGRVWWRPNEASSDDGGSGDRLDGQREGFETDFDEIYGRISDGFYALDDEWRFTYVNDRAARLIDYQGEGLVGKRIWDVFEWGSDSILGEEYREAKREQEQTSFEFYYPEPLDAWYEMHAYPSESGLSVYFQDVTERKDRERELEQYEALTETASDVILTIDDQSCVQTVNPSVEDVFGYDPEELVGESLTALMPERLRGTHWDGIGRYLRTGERQLDWNYVELPGATADGTEIPIAISFGEYTYEGQHYFTGIIRDISERKGQERRLEESERRYRTIAEYFPNGIVTLFDHDLRYTLAAGKGFDDIPVDPSDVEGQHFRSVWDEDTVAVLEPAFEAALAGEEQSVEVAYADREWVIHVVPITDERGDVFAGMTLAQDITERKSRKRKLTRQRTRLQNRERVLRSAYEIIADRDRSFADQVDALLSLVRESVGTHYATFSSVQGDTYVFEAIDVPANVDLQAGETVPLADLPNCERVVETEQTLVLRDVEADAPELADPTWGIACYLGVPVFAGDEVYGTFCFYGMEPHREEFSDWEIAFVELLGNWLSYELERRQRTDQLAALNDLHDLTRGITDAVIDQSTREAIEDAVVDHLADTDSYQFAWIGEVDTATETVTVQTEAGVDGYLDDTTITVGPDDEHSGGPTGRALQTGEIQTTQDSDSDPQYEPWRDLAAEYGFQSSAAIPITYGDTVYGVLNVYAERPHAFEGEERAVISQLGEVVGHAIAAVDRKRALMSDELVELEFQISDVFGALDVDADSGGTITLDDTVPLSGDDYLVFGHATADAVESTEALVEAIPGWTSVTFDDPDEDTAFELRVSEPPVLSTLASIGGSVESAVIEDGDYHMTLHAPTSADVRQLTDVVQEAYPQAEMLTKRQLTRTDDTDRTLDSAFTQRLTERQRTALRAAYYAGFFEWPREADGQDVAGSLDISGPTFHQHLRKAEKKVFDALFSATT